MAPVGIQIAQLPDTHHHLPHLSWGKLLTWGTSPNTNTFKGSFLGSLTLASLSSLASCHSSMKQSLCQRWKVSSITMWWKVSSLTMNSSLPAFVQAFPLLCTLHPQPLLEVSFSSFPYHLRLQGLFYKSSGLPPKQSIPSSMLHVLLLILPFLVYFSIKVPDLHLWNLWLSETKACQRRKLQKTWENWSSERSATCPKSHS